MKEPVLPLGFANGCTGKRRYRDRLSSLLALTSTGRKRHTRRPKDEIRSYRCPHCKGWHLTSEPKRSRRGRS